MSEPSISIHETIYRTLRHRIMFGEIEPGKVFTIRGLANEFLVSMTPVRDATRRLVAEGALTMSVSGRIKSPELNSDRIEELFSIKYLLEPELAIRAIPRVHPALIERLIIINSLSDEMIAKENSAGYIKSDIEFHKTLYLRAQSPAMLAVLETVWLQSGPTMKLLFDKRIRDHSNQNHRLILLALKSNNKCNLVSAIQADIGSGLAMLLN
jgi:DNA-binding GntR family transcriptional regulator